MSDGILNDWAEAEAEKIACFDQLTDEQQAIIEFAYKTISNVQDSMRNTFDLTLQDARNISTAEWKLRAEFPSITQGD